VDTYGFQEQLGCRKFARSVKVLTGINLTRGLNMNKVNSARRILEAFKDGVKFLCLRDLARNAGFARASDRDFKEGFNYLVKKGIIKLQQSGWSSEERGTHSHPKTVILTANLYELKDSEFEIDSEKMFGFIGAAKQEDPDFELVPIFTPLKERSYISKKAYDLEKDYCNFWRPVKNGSEKG
jgi:hypothetical protein